ncbi:MAG: Diacylglycerol kinase [Alphaproteobacteria bacterium MarineAlpha2_Bin1]|nr:MAG: Diacylglycerol kinase [Alphaproteobacteria bacterium MarineAlpha2_Bin1]|tara:strand:+ start:1369 stop:2268 length:900 start_codon:yes stop_codon:yes gene_type:complete
MNLKKTREKFTIITNPTAGNGKKKKLLEIVSSKLVENSMNIEIIESTNSNHAKEIAYRSSIIGNTIIACGGDGHVSNLSSIAAKNKTKFGIIPTGTGNDFATSLGLYNIHNIVSALVNNKIELIDLWKLNNEVFCSVANIGFSAKANEWANKRKFLRGSLLYFTSVISTIFNYKPLRLKVEVDEKIFEKKTWLIACANTSFFGGGMNIAPFVSPSDGFIDLVCVGDVSRYEFLKTFPKVYSGEHINHHSISYIRGKKIIIDHRSKKNISVFADGEDYGNLPIKIEPLNFKLKQLVPIIN